MNQYGEMNQAFHHGDGGGHGHDAPCTCNHCKDQGQASHSHEDHHHHHHHHDHSHACGCGHQNDHVHACACGHHHDHDHSCACGHHHDHSHACACGHHHDHDHACACGHHHDHDMDNHDHHTGRLLSFEGQSNASCQSIWQVLTNPDAAAIWLPGLQLQDLRPGGHVSYKGQQYLVLDVEPGKLLSLTWNEGTLDLLLEEEGQEACRILLNYYMETISKDSSEDLAKWLMALQALDALAQGQTFEVKDQDYQNFKHELTQLLDQDLASLEIE